MVGWARTCVECLESNLEKALELRIGRLGGGIQAEIQPGELRTSCLELESQQKARLLAGWQSSWQGMRTRWLVL